MNMKTIIQTGKFTHALPTTKNMLIIPSPKLINYLRSVSIKGPATLGTD
jgi:hypothetical protein